MDKLFRFHAGTLEYSMKSTRVVSGVYGVIAVCSSLVGSAVKNVHISSEPIKDERLLPYGWGDTEYMVLGDLDGFTNQCIGYTNFFE